MRVVIGYPPLKSTKGTPLLSQNRQFQWFKNPTYIYPVVPAYAATILKQAGHQVKWLDGIAQQWTEADWLKRVKGFKPDLVFMETKTPVIKQHWQIISRIKQLSSKIRVVLAGDHVTALPEESFKNSQVDYVLTGGDYDWLLLNLVEHFCPEDDQPLAETKKLEPGIWYRQASQVKSTGLFQLKHNLNQLPLIDRQLSHWQDYAYKNGNFKATPGAYIMASRDCWWRKHGGCSFCSWTTLYPQYRVRRVQAVLTEVEALVKDYQVKEIMDDSGTFPAGQWLQTFCQGMIKRGLNQQLNFDCNLRFGALKKRDYQLMAQAGFRLLLFGLESANQSTLDQLNKGTKLKTIIKELKIINQVNQEFKGQLQPHLTFMFGYPWETKAQVHKTLALAKKLFKSGLIDSLQATLIIPYPGTALFKQAEQNQWLLTQDWNDFDMQQPVLKTVLTDQELRQLRTKFYWAFLSPEFIRRQLLNIKSLADFKFLFRAAAKVISHSWKRQ